MGQIEWAMLGRTENNRVLYFAVLLWAGLILSLLMLALEVLSFLI